MYASQTLSPSSPQPLPRSSFRVRHQARQGIILVLSTFIMVIVFAMAAFAVDLGYIVLVQAQLQNAADAATLAGVIELGAAIEPDQAKQNAIDEAKKVALYNEAGNRPVTLSDSDIQIGSRSHDESGVTVEWGGEGPYNAIQVSAARDNPNPDAPNGRLELFFADVMYHLNGKDAYLASVGGSAQAHLTPRDMVFVIDRSGSMEEDSMWKNGYVGGPEVTAIFDALFGDGSAGSGGTFSGGEKRHPNSLSNYPGAQSLYNWCLSNDVFHRNKTGSQLTETQFFDQEFPANELPSGASSNEHWKHWKWDAFCRFMWNMGHTNTHYTYSSVGWGSFGNNQYRKFSQRQYVQFLQVNGYLPAYKGQDFYVYNTSGHTNNKLFPLPVHSDAWQNYPLVPSNPINLVRNAALAGIEEMESGNIEGALFFDQLGYVSYGTLATKDFYLDPDLSEVKRAAANLVSGAYGENGRTNIQMGIKQGRQLLTEDVNHREFTTRLIVLLSDGLPNIYNDSGSSNNGLAYDNSLVQAQLAADRGIYIHTIALGEGADLDLMREIANIGNGTMFTADADDQDGLSQIFVDIARDRLGKLFKPSSN
ncbi:Hypothetical protein PBC10988_24510 [Planctomycetales bacterium 10988]|nr:Hypothetical protein PBC10988_24510 [Planctomycetales bacterium 10988]